jgi:hypothetical protein
MKKCIPLMVFSIAALMVCFIAGCGQRELPKPDMAPVRGKIMVRGEPARYVMIRLNSKDGRYESTGFTDEEGTFELRTLSNSGEPDGAVPGEYTVTLEPYDPVTCPPIPKDAVPTQLAGDLKVDQVIVVESGDNDVLVDVP